MATWVLWARGNKQAKRGKGEEGRGEGGRKHRARGEQAARSEWGCMTQADEQLHVGAILPIPNALPKSQFTTNLFHDKGRNAKDHG